MSQRPALPCSSHIVFPRFPPQLDTVRDRVVSDDRRWERVADENALLRLQCQELTSANQALRGSLLEAQAEAETLRGALERADAELAEARRARVVADAARAGQEGAVVRQHPWHLPLSPTAPI